MLHHAVVSAASVDARTRAGAAVWAWTVDDPAELTRLEAAGVDAVITNDPGSFRAWLHSRREARTRIYPARGLSRRRSALRGGCSPAPSADWRTGRRPARRRRRAADDHHHDHDDDDADLPRPTTIAAGVTVGGEVLVGACHPLRPRGCEDVLRAAPCSARQGDAVRDAEAARRVRLCRRCDQARARVRAGRQRAAEGGRAAAALERYRRSSRSASIAAVDSELNLRNSKPFVTKEQQGRRLRQSTVVRDLF